MAYEQQVRTVAPQPIQTPMNQGAPLDAALQVGGKLLAKQEQKERMEAKKRALERHNEQSTPLQQIDTTRFRDQTNYGKTERETRLRLALEHNIVAGEADMMSIATEGAGSILAAETDEQRAYGLKQYEEKANEYLENIPDPEVRLALAQKFAKDKAKLSNSVISLGLEQKRKQQLAERRFDLMQLGGSASSGDPELIQRILTAAQDGTGTLTPQQALGLIDGMLQRGESGGWVQDGIDNGTYNAVLDKDFPEGYADRRKQQEDSLKLLGIRGKDLKKRMKMFDDNAVLQLGMGIANKEIPTYGDQIKEVAGNKEQAREWIRNNVIPKAEKVGKDVAKMTGDANLGSLAENAYIAAFEKDIEKWYKYLENEKRKSGVASAGAVLEAHRRLESPSARINAEGKLEKKPLIPPDGLDFSKKSDIYAYNKYRKYVNTMSVVGGAQGNEVGDIEFAHTGIQFALELMATNDKKVMTANMNNPDGTDTPLASKEQLVALLRKEYKGNNQISVEAANQIADEFITMRDSSGYLEVIFGGQVSQIGGSHYTQIKNKAVKEVEGRKADGEKIADPNEEARELERKGLDGLWGHIVQQRGNGEVNKADSNLHWENFIRTMPAPNEIRDKALIMSQNSTSPKIKLLAAGYVLDSIEGVEIPTGAMTHDQVEYFGKTINTKRGDYATIAGGDGLAALVGFKLVEERHETNVTPDKKKTNEIVDDVEDDYVYQPYEKKMFIPGLQNIEAKKKNVVRIAMQEAWKHIDPDGTINEDEVDAQLAQGATVHYNWKTGNYVVMFVRKPQEMIPTEPENVGDPNIIQRREMGMSKPIPIAQAAIRSALAVERTEETDYGRFGGMAP